MNDNTFRLLLDLWMWHDGIGDTFGLRLDDAVTKECNSRGLDVVTAYHVFTPRRGTDVDA